MHVHTGQIALKSRGLPRAGRLLNHVASHFLCACRTRRGTVDAAALKRSRHGGMVEPANNGAVNGMTRRAACASETG